MNIGKRKKQIIGACVGETKSWTELKDLTGLSHTKISVHLRELQEGGYIEKVEGRYRATAEGAKIYEAFMREVAAGQSEPVEINMIDFLNQKISSSIKETAISMTGKPLERVKRGFVAAFLGAKHIPASESEKRRLGHLAEHLAKGTKLALYPSPSSPQEQRRIIDVAFNFFREISKIRYFREKIAKEKKLTVMLTMDLGDVKEDWKIISSALYWIFS